MKISTVTNLILLGILTVTFSGCTNNIVQISDEESFSYIKKYEAEYQQTKSNSQNTEQPFKWIQATNKNEPCKLYVEYNSNDDKTLKDGYKIFWDGSCKDGYAFGLGREMERGFLTKLDAIALYTGEKKKPKCFIQKDYLQNITAEGDISNGSVVGTKIVDNGMEFDIQYAYGKADLSKPLGLRYAIQSSPFSNEKIYMKIYPNFFYKFTVHLDDKNQQQILFETIDTKTNNPNGFFSAFGKPYGVEVIQNKLVRRGLILSESYFNHFKNIFMEINNLGQIAIDDQKKALMVKQQYKDLICKDDVKVDFIDNKEYKAICNENEQIAQLKIKIDAKLAQIEQQNQAKRQQQNQQRLIQAREAEAEAAQRQAAAAETANFNQSLQNFNNNMQMQQLNNNLMMNNMMPKRYDVYVH